jgi:hypothetical protein
MIPLDETVLSKIMNGFRVPAPEIRKRIAVLLDANEQWLFEVNTMEPLDSGAQIQPETA